MVTPTLGWRKCTVCPDLWKRLEAPGGQRQGLITICSQGPQNAWHPAGTLSMSADWLNHTLLGYFNPKTNGNVEQLWPSSIATIFCTLPINDLSSFFMQSYRVAFMSENTKFRETTFLAQYLRAKNGYIWPWVFRTPESTFYPLRLVFISLNTYKIWSGLGLNFGKTT